MLYCPIDSHHVNCKYNEKFKKYEPISKSSVNDNASMIDLSKLKICN